MFGRKKAEDKPKKNKYADPYPPYDPENPPCKCKFDVESVEILEKKEVPLIKKGEQVGIAIIGTTKAKHVCSICGKSWSRIDYNKLIHTLMEIDG